MTTPNPASVTPRRSGRILPLALCAAAMLLADAVRADTVEVHGRASAFVEPDRITIQLGVERSASTPRDAYEALETAVRAVYLALAEAGIDTASSVRTQHLRLWSERRSQDREHRASFMVPAGRTTAGDVVRNSVSADIAPSGRQIDVAAHWHQPLDVGELRLGAVVTRQSGHRAAENFDLTLLSGWRSTF